MLGGTTRACASFQQHGSTDDVSSGSDSNDEFSLASKVYCAHAVCPMSSIPLLHHSPCFIGTACIHTGLSPRLTSLFTPPFHPPPPPPTPHPPTHTHMPHTPASPLHHRQAVTTSTRSDLTPSDASSDEDSVRQHRSGRSHPTPVC